MELALVGRPAAIPVRKHRRLVTFDSRESAYRYSVRNFPHKPRGSVTVCPATPVKEDGAWLLSYAVTFPGHVKYFRLGRGGHLVKA
jgi:hypothetical protein